MNTTLIVIEGVLRKPVGGSVIPEGVRLYKSLCSTGRVVLLSVTDTKDPEREAMESWLELNGLVQHDLVSWGDIGPRAPLANMYRREGYDVDLIVDPDPEAVLDLIRAGFNTLLFTHSEYAIPAWRPDAPTGVRPWHDVVSAAKEQAALKAKDARLRNEE